MPRRAAAALLLKLRRLAPISADVSPRFRFQSLRHARASLLRTDDDALAAFRDRIAMQISLIAVVVLLPFTASHLWAGRYGLGGLILAAQMILFVNTLALRRGQPPPVPFAAMSVGLGLAVCGSIVMQGIHGVTWSYPTLFIFFFVLRRRVALPLSLLLVAGATVAAAFTINGPMATRVFATLGLTLVMINVVLNVIGDLQGKLVVQTITDPLTGAFNRRHFDAQLAQLPPPPAATGAAGALLAVDLDHFKAINDSLGHAVGDGVLQGVVAVLNARKRPSDRLFRTGGEEFVLLLPRITVTDAARLADELRERIEAAPLLAGQAVTVSIGVAAQRAGRDAAAWLLAADEALYQAKRSGRNRVVTAA